MERQRVSNRRGRQSREEILEAAAHVMGQRGYAAASLSALSAEIGLTKSVILHHFQTKGGLLTAVMERGMNDFFDAMSRAHANPPAAGTPGERLSWFLKCSAGVLIEREEFLRLHMFLVLGDDEDIAESDVAQTISKVRREGKRHVHHMIRESFREYGAEVAETIAARLERFGMAGIDGAFLGGQTETAPAMSEQMDDLAEAIALMGEALAERLRATELTTSSS